MLDVASGGRVISGFVRGISAEYFSTAVNPTHSRERFYEAAELILRAWTEEGPFAFDGRFYRYPYVNPWPRPLQRPHPPVWCPSQGSKRNGGVGGPAPLSLPDGLHARSSASPRSTASTARRASATATRRAATSSR